jgi:hypothetical protein
VVVIRAVSIDLADSGEKCVPLSPARSPRTVWAFAASFFVTRPAEDHTMAPPDIEDFEATESSDLAMGGTLFKQQQQFSATVEDVPEDEDEVEDLIEIDKLGPTHTPDLEAEDDGDLSENDDGDIGDVEEVEETLDDTKKGYWPAPTVVSAKVAYDRIKKILRPPRDTGNGYKDPKLDLLLRSRLEAMKQMLWCYVNPESRTYDKWTASSLETATMFEKGPWFSRHLRQWAAAEENLPFNIYGTWNKSRIDDEDLKQEILTHLQSIGKFICAQDISRYMARREVRRRYGMKKVITERTARNWLHRLGYRWTLEPSGQYVDGHERDNVVKYRQTIFIPRWMELEPCLRIWTLDGHQEDLFAESRPPTRRLVVWFHDESTFYANDRRKKRWCHESEKAVPRAKGEGASLMVADFVSADYGWLRSPDGQEVAHVLFKAGKNREGYFTNENILEQTKKAMDIAQKYYPDDDHIFVFDNATTHLKWPDTALSAQKMTKGPSKTFGAEVTVIVNGKPQYTVDGKPQKRTIPMGPGTFADGTPQSFYNENGTFKGMTRILQECGLTTESKLKAQCEKFKCAPDATDCCQRQVLYNQPDFANQDSALEIACKARGFEVMFLPKFHCELNFIEQCWGHSKRVYRQYPASTKEDDLQKNLLSALESVPMATMRRYVLFTSVPHCRVQKL